VVRRTPSAAETSSLLEQVALAALAIAGVLLFVGALS
jgi:hypothetical protein